MKVIEQNKIIEGNKLIAEFVGGIFKKAEDAPKSTDFGDGYFINTDFIPIGHLDYHSSWDWQVPVWGKIALLVKTLLGEKIYSHIDVQQIYLNRIDKYEQAIFLNKPEDGQKIIVELIEWYNQNK